MTTQYSNVIPPAGVLIFAPHPDDDVLSSAVLIQRALAAKVPVHVVFLTSGESNPWPQRYVERKWLIKKSDSDRWAATRMDEARSALLSLGVEENNVEFLRWPDLGVTNLLLSGSEEPVVRLMNIITHIKPGAIVVPALSDLHPDHSAAGVLFEIIRARLAGTPQNFEWFWYLVHTPKSVERAADIQTVATSDERERKRHAIARHKTQTALSARRFLGFADTPEMFFTHSNPCTQPYTLSRKGDRLLINFEEPAYARLYQRRIFLRGENGGTNGGVERIVCRRGATLPKEVHFIGELAKSSPLFFKYEFRPIFRDYSGWIEL